MNAGNLSYISPATMGTEIHGRVRTLTWDQFSTLWRTGGGELVWDCLFVRPPWIDAWSRTLAREPGQVLAVYDLHGDLIGLAPLIPHAQGMQLWGDPEVCDYMDLIYAPGRATEVLKALVRWLYHNGVRRLMLGPLPENSATLSAAPLVADRLGAGLIVTADTPLYAMRLPDSWDAYLAGLAGKQRHEVRRKLRRLNDAGPVNFAVHESLQAVTENLDGYLALFRSNRVDKRQFMAPPMAAYFDQLCRNMARHGYARLSILSLAGLAVAAALCFDDGQTVYLYNNGYDQRYAHLSVGQLCKVMSIRHSIREGRRDYNFLKGDERYKHHLGGQPHQLKRLTLDLTTLS